MTRNPFRLSAKVSSDRPDAVRPVLEELVGEKGTVRREGDDLLVDATMEGTDAKDLNRALLSALRRVEKKTRLRSEWTDAGGTTYRFFDYVLKKTVQG
jgi:hypothetical protein